MANIKTSICNIMISQCDEKNALFIKKTKQKKQAVYLDKLSLIV